MSTTLLVLLLSCTGSNDGDTGGGVGDSGGTDGGAAVTTCDDGLRMREFQQATQDDSLFALAANTTIPTLAGDYILQDHWDGCDVMLFINDEPPQARSSDWGKSLWERDVAELFARAPANTIFFFGSDEADAADRDANLSMLQAEVLDAFRDMTEEEQAWWEPRIHYIDGRYRDVYGWVGDVIKSPGWGAVLDRTQHIRYIGSYADSERYSSSAGWFEPNLSMAANEAVHANYLAALAQHREDDGATVVTLWEKELISDTSWAGERGSVSVALPDPDTMAGFDTLELDMTMDCNGSGEYGTCPPWDYLVYLYLCDEGQTEGCGTEFGRWITTYHRQAEWMHDVSDLLPLIAGGGMRTFEFYTTQEYEISLSLRLSNQGKPTRPVSTRFLFSGGAFDADYNDAYKPIDVDIPATATKVELATVISGHGQVSPGTCAEFCPTEHHFYVNGTDNVQVLDNAGTDSGCMDMVEQGVVPNQYGTWWYGRSGWCPGWLVPMVVTDVTDQVTPGTTATFDYEGFRDGQPYESGGANIVMSSFVVVHE